MNTTQGRSLGRYVNSGTSTAGRRIGPLWFALVTIFTCSSSSASFIKFIDFNQGLPPVIQSDNPTTNFGVAAEWALGTLLTPTGSVPLGFRVVLLTDPVSAQVTDLLTLDASSTAAGTFVYMNFVSAGGLGFASEVAAYTGQPFASAIPETVGEQDLSGILNSGSLTVLFQTGELGVPDTGGTGPLLGLALLGVGICLSGRSRRTAFRPWLADVAGQR